MKKLFLLALVAASSLWLAPAHALCGGGNNACFVVAAGGNSNTAATWTSSSNGTHTSETTPATTDFICLDSAAGNLTVNASLQVAGIDESGATTGGAGVACTTASGSAYTHAMNINAAVTLTISPQTGTGVFKMVSNGLTVSNTSSSTITFGTANANDVNISANFASANVGAITINEKTTSTVSLLDSFSQGTNSVFTLTQGGMDSSANNPNFTVGQFISNNTNTRSIALGSSTVTITTITGGAGWSHNQGGGTLTVTAGSSTLQFTGSPTIQRLMSLLNKTYGNITIPAGGSTGYLLTHTGATINALNVTCPGALQITNGQTLTTGVITATSSCSTANTWLLQSSTTGATATISSASAGNALNAIIRDITFTGGGTFTATNSINQGNNSGITFTGSFGGGGGGNVIGD